MLIQRLMDGVCWLLAQLVGLLPDSASSPELATAISGALDGAGDLGAVVSKFGIIFPFDTVGVLLGLFIAMIGVWAGSLGVRLILWAFGR